MKYKVILNVYIADKLLKAGFVPVEFTMSKKIENRVAFVFEYTDEFKVTLDKISQE